MAPGDQGQVISAEAGRGAVLQVWIESARPGWMESGIEQGRIGCAFANVGVAVIQQGVRLGCRVLKGRVGLWMDRRARRSGACKGGREYVIIENLCVEENQRRSP